MRSPLSSGHPQEEQSDCLIEVDGLKEVFQNVVRNKVKMELLLFSCGWLQRKLIKEEFDVLCSGHTKAYYPKPSPCTDCMYMMLCLMSCEKKLDLVYVVLCQNIAL